MSKNWITPTETTLITLRPEVKTLTAETQKTDASPAPRIRLGIEELEARTAPIAVWTD